MLVSDLVTKIKREARIDGDTQLDAMVLDLINELTNEMIILHEPSEALVLDLAAITVDADGIMALPSDFLKVHRVEYTGLASVGTWELSDRHGQYPGIPKNWTHPRVYEILKPAAATTVKRIKVTPLVVGGSIKVEYFGSAVALTGVNPEVYPIDSLLPKIQRETVARIHIFHDRVQAAGALKGTADEAEQAFVQGYKANERKP